MKLLILGGTIFLGRHLVDSARAAGHEVTLFNRGKHNADLFPGIEKLRGDRANDLSALEGRRWDACIDTSGYVPRVVRSSAELLAGSVDHYTFISSVSVYADLSTPGMDETAAVGTLEDETTEEVTGETYGPLKALCEQAAGTAMPGRTLTVRPGLIVGPHDPSDRFTYWPVRVARGGEVLAPGKPGTPVQFIDARDLADWIIRMVEGKHTGVYHATGPADPLSMGGFLETCKSATGSDARFTWVDEEFLAKHEVHGWTDLPLWIPDSENASGLSQINLSKAIGAGLTFRPLPETIRDTVAWAASLPSDRDQRSGLKPDRETEVLTAWHNRAE